MKKLPANPFSNASGTTVDGLADDGAMVAIGAAKLATGGSASGWYVCIDNTNIDYGHFQAADPMSNPVSGDDHISY